MYTIAKSFEFDYAHRVWNQELNIEFSLDSDRSCRHIHGHRAKVIVYLNSRYLIQGMVTDFKHLNWFKLFLNSIDHKFLIDKNDPLFPCIKGCNNVDVIACGYKDDYERFHTASLFHNESASPYIIEYLESFIILPFIPTAENMCEWLYNIIQREMRDLKNVSINAVEFYETPNCCARYGDI